MSLPTNKNDNKGGKTPKNMGAGGSKFITKPASKSAGPAKKPVKTGGSRGSWLNVKNPLRYERIFYILPI